MLGDYLSLLKAQERRTSPHIKPLSNVKTLGHPMKFTLDLPTSKPRTRLPTSLTYQWPSYWQLLRFQVEETIQCHFWLGHSLFVCRASDLSWIAVCLFALSISRRSSLLFPRQAPGHSTETVHNHSPSTISSGLQWYQYSSPLISYQNSPWALLSSTITSTTRALAEF